MSEQDEVRKKLREITKWWKGEENVGKWFDCYLSSGGPSSDRILGQWYSEFAKGHVEGQPSFLRGDIGLDLRAGRIFADVASALPKIPASEAICERTISHLESMFPAKRGRSAAILIRAQMIIRMYYVFRPECDLLAAQ
jgi:hypothetical protein